MCYTPLKELQHVIPHSVHMFLTPFFALSQETATLVSSYMVEEIIRFPKMKGEALKSMKL